jgi:hypothetical protein
MEDPQARKRPCARIERMNDRIDAGDWSGRDLWAAVVHAIHELQIVSRN